MKSPADKRLGILAAACTLAVVCGCQSPLFKHAAKSKRESADFQKKVATDPFPTAQQSGFLGN
jgi:hypothetical protein